MTAGLMIHFKAEALQGVDGLGSGNIGELGEGPGFCWGGGIGVEVERLSLGAGLFAFGAQLPELMAQVANFGAEELIVVFELGLFFGELLEGLGEFNHVIFRVTVLVEEGVELFDLVVFMGDRRLGSSLGGLVLAEGVLEFGLVAIALVEAGAERVVFGLEGCPLLPERGKLAAIAFPLLLHSPAHAPRRQPAPQQHHRPEAIKRSRSLSRKRRLTPAAQVVEQAWPIIRGPIMPIGAVNLVEGDRFKAHEYNP